MASDGLMSGSAFGGSPTMAGVATRSSFGGIGGFGGYGGFGGMPMQSGWGQPMFGGPTWGQPYGGFGGFGGFGVPTWGMPQAFSPFYPTPMSSVERSYGFSRAPFTDNPVDAWKQRQRESRLAQMTPLQNALNEVQNAGGDA